MSSAIMNRADMLLHCPTNLSLPPGTGVAYVDSDVFDICNRVKEVDPNLKVVVYEGQEDKYTHGIVEDTRDGIKLVFKIGPASKETPELDGRVIRKLVRLQSVPLNERLKLIEKEEAAYEREWKENQLDELYENLGRPMWTQLEHDGFIDSRGISYPKLGVSSKGRRAR